MNKDILYLYDEVRARSDANCVNLQAPNSYCQSFRRRLYNVDECLKEKKYLLFVKQQFGIIRAFSSSNHSLIFASD